MKPACLAPSLLLLLAAGSFASPLRVPADFPDIQQAIQAAEDGDEILVDAGDWAGPLDFLGKSLELRSTAGAGQTYLVGSPAGGFVVVIEGVDSAVIEGFTIRDGLGQPGSNGFDGGGLRVLNSSLHVEASQFRNNRGALGGAISAQGSALSLIEVDFEANSALLGGALFAESSTSDLSAVSFSGNEAVNFGGAIAVLGGEFAASELDIRDNHSGSLGGGLFAAHASLQVQDSLFARNGRATPSQNGSSWQVHTLGGGGFYTSNSSGTIQRSRIIDNIAAFGSGAYVAGSGPLELVNVLVAGNATACDCGLGALYTNGASPRVLNSTFADNGGFATVFTTINSAPRIENSILAGNQNSTAGHGQALISYSLLEGVPFNATLGDGVILGLADLDADRDYAPLAGSAVIDAGSNLLLGSGIATDLLGQPRRVDDPDSADTGEGEAPIVDIGAIEFQVDAPADHDLIFSHCFSLSG